MVHSKQPITWRIVVIDMPTAGTNHGSGLEGQEVAVVSGVSDSPKTRPNGLREWCESAEHVPRPAAPWTHDLTEPMCSTDHCGHLQERQRGHCPGFACFRGCVALAVIKLNMAIVMAARL
ncbi:hypothetical protein GE21DRAFT_208 [Neurospora crassa]|uniref:Uncharacterized protein n=1 Tax=Neurospora crassa (strain ATCC 24698 / 74-OR23-1A / CBS 708.71 / DSM 1257 / FGSC 987) TaxID=367110 RepID=Q7SFR6_NEUCR|nr:hypothetical protein NCU09084 [Neurospora crassa OR74A]EAA35665.1 hypothetical protein NCU09084 [Neurospora crassa OR74A]KHE82452.1 hypothetical protein GE21DRAFT_208 [Neurospora crassa]|eukprot:XP_964901.1 hypothetical protein NCU09084 [Neurospora crassa OR74A]